MQKVKGEGEEGEEGEEEQPPAEEEEGEDKKPKFNVEDHQWTVTNRKPKNLPKLFMTMKGISGVIEGNKSSSMYSTTQMEAISRGLDEFCKLVLERYESGLCTFQQVHFAQ